jgi:hypothetical protein
MPATQPTKEQVRAYMHARVRNRDSDRLPPPPPEEIRQLLGWHHCAAPQAPAAAPVLLLPGSMLQLATLLTVEWCFLVAGISRRS